MIVKHHHSCMLCSRQRTCFKFRDFVILFALCRQCYDAFTDEFKNYEAVTDYCSFCEKERPCKVISGFEDSMFFSPLKICDECAGKIVHEVSVHNV